MLAGILYPIISSTLEYLSVIWREMRDREKRGQKQIKRSSVRYDLLYFESDLQC